MRWIIATWLLTLRVFAADPFFDAQFQALAQFNPRYVGGLVGDWAWASPGQYLLNGQGISVTYDRSGLGHDLLQATAASQPLISRTDNAGNLLVRSQEFETTWTRSRVNAFGATDTGATNAGSFANTARTLDPVGGNNADFVQEDATASNTHNAAQQSITVVQSSSPVVYEISLKAAGRSWVKLSVFDTAFTSSINCFFNVSTGAVGAASNVGSGSGATGNIVAQANGFYLCRLSGIPGSTGTGITVGTYIASDASTTSYNGNSTDGLFLYGASFRPADWSTNYVQTTATPALPGLNGLATAYFDGVDDYLKSAAFTLNQPTFIAMVAKQVTWTANDTLFDGSANSSGRFYQQGVAPNLTIIAGSATAFNTSCPIGAFSISRVAFNGSSSSIQINKLTATTGDAGSANMGLFTLGVNGGFSAWANIQVARVLVYNRIPSAAEQDYIVRGLATQYGLNP